MEVRHSYEEVYEHAGVEYNSNWRFSFASLLLRLLDSNTITERGADYAWAISKEVL